MLYPWGFSSNDPSVTPEHECDLSVRKALRLNKYSRFYVPLGKYMECLLDFFLHMSVFDKYIVHGIFFFFLDIRISAFKRQTLDRSILVNWLHGFKCKKAIVSICFSLPLFINSTFSICTSSICMYLVIFYLIFIQLGILPPPFKHVLIEIV